MNTGKAIRKILFISMWLVIGSGMVILLVAAIGKQRKDQCRDFSITIKGKQHNFFVNEKNVQQLLITAAGGPIKGQPISTLNLYQLQQLLEKNNWISDAELYFDNRDVLHVIVKEREPIARIFTAAGTSYYIDGSGKRMPLSDKMSARVPVFTNFPEKKILTAKDSLLLNDVKTVAAFIVNDPFWMAQVSQIDITADRNFEMTPVVGNHLVKLGNGDDIAEKFHRLFVFYNQVLSKTGFDKYKTIDVQYTGQVVASKQTGTTKVDSVQLRKNVEKLLQQAKEAQDDTISTAQPLTEKPIKTDSITVHTTDLKVTHDKSNLPAAQSGEKSTSPNPLKSTLKSQPTEKKITDPPKPVKDDKKPKAVMPKKIVVSGK